MTAVTGPEELAARIARVRLSLPLEEPDARGHVRALLLEAERALSSVSEACPRSAADPKYGPPPRLRELVSSLESSLHDVTGLVRLAYELREEAARYAAVMAAACRVLAVFDAAGVVAAAAAFLAAGAAGLAGLAALAVAAVGLGVAVGGAVLYARWRWSQGLAAAGSLALLVLGGAVAVGPLTGAALAVGGEMISARIASLASAAGGGRPGQA